MRPGHTCRGSDLLLCQTGLLPRLSEILAEDDPGSGRNRLVRRRLGGHVQTPQLGVNIISSIRYHGSSDGDMVNKRVDNLPGC